jgi:hypothetical protein
VFYAYAAGPTAVTPNVEARAVAGQWALPPPPTQSGTSASHRHAPQAVLGGRHLCAPHIWRAGAVACRIRPQRTKWPRAIRGQLTSGQHISRTPFSAQEMCCWSASPRRGAHGVWRFATIFEKNVSAPDGANGLGCHLHAPGGASGRRVFSVFFFYAVGGRVITILQNRVLGGKHPRTTFP